MKRIGLLGGTFNPIHLGHLAMAQMSLEECHLDKIIFIPSYLPPHKTVKNLAPAEHRYAMVRLAIGDHPQFTVSNYEIQKGGKSYSIETIRFFRRRHPPGTKFFFIVGEDALEGLSTWKDSQEIQKLVTFLVVNRPGYNNREGRVPYRSIRMPDIDIASSFLRNRVAQGKSIKYFVPEKVLRYIKRHRLYKK